MKHRFAFRLRDLLWLVVLSAVCVAWWLDHKQLVAEIRQSRTVTNSVVEQIENEGYHVWSTDNVTFHVVKSRFPPKNSN